MIITTDVPCMIPWGHLQAYKHDNNNRCTLYDTIFYKPEDDPMGSKHVALFIVA